MITLKCNNKLNKTFVEIIKMSHFKEEKEVLLFPFSLFKIISKKENNPKENRYKYEIELDYLDDYNDEVPKIKGYDGRIESQTKKWVYIISYLVLIFAFYFYYYKKKNIN